MPSKLPLAALVAAACTAGCKPAPLVFPDAGEPDAHPPAVDAAPDGPASVFEFVPPSLDFGYVESGTNSGPLELDVLNRGSSPISGFALALSGDDTLELVTIETTCTSTLDPGGCKMELGFDPRADGDHTMTMTAMAPGQVSASATIHAIGGVEPHPFGTSVSSLQFGTVTVGLVSGQVVTYQNSGTTTLPPISFAFAGESPGQYRLVDDHCTGVQLAPLATCTVDVDYAPTSLATPGEAILYGTASDTSELDLHGTPGSATALAISPTSYDFGQVHATGSANVPFTITNTGTATATGIAVTMYNTQFVVTSSTCTVPLVPNASCAIDVQLVPTATGPDGGGMLVYGANASGDEATFTAIGIPAQGVILDTWSHDFGTAVDGQIGNSYTFTVTNVGTMATTVALDFDDDPTQFMFANDNCSATSLAAGNTCTFDVVYTPTHDGDCFARVHATSMFNDAIAGLTAMATPADQPLHFGPGAWDFTNTGIGASDYEEFFLVNPGFTTKTPTSLSLSGPNADEFELADDMCTGTPLVTGASCYVTVWYVPSVVGTNEMATMTALWATGSATAALTADGAFRDPDVFVTCDPPSYDFGAVTVGQTATSTFVLTNYGATTSAPVAFMMLGMNPSEFSLTADTCTGVALATSDTCSVGVVFQPMSTGSKQAELIPNVGEGPSLSGSGQ